MKEAVPIISNAMLVGDKAKFLAMLLTLKVQRAGIHLRHGACLVPGRKAVVTGFIASARDWGQHGGTGGRAANGSGNCRRRSADTPSGSAAVWDNSCSFAPHGAERNSRRRPKGDRKKPPPAPLAPCHLSQCSGDSDELSVISVLRRWPLRGGRCSTPLRAGGFPGWE